MLSVALFSAAFAQAATVDTLSVWSASMNKGVEVVVVVPDGARTKTGPAYPVLYLLHGASGYHGDWAEKGNMRQIADETIAAGTALPMIVVMPDASGILFFK